MTERRLLVVDDERDFAEMVVRVATPLGYAATVTTTSSEFMARYKSEAPDVIVLDIVMPDKDGIELMRWLVDEGCRARIIIISGYNPAYANAAKVIGEFSGQMPIAYLQKPVKLADLRAALA